MSSVDEFSLFDPELPRQAAKTRYLDKLQSELERRIQQRDKEAMSYLERELRAVSDDPYFREIISGGNPSVPD